MTTRHVVFKPDYPARGQFSLVGQIVDIISKDLIEGTFRIRFTSGQYLDQVRRQDLAFVKQW